jgi:hypothetical protein
MGPLPGMPRSFSQDVEDMLAQEADGGGLILLFDIGVEGVVEYADIGVRDLFAEALRVGCGIEEEGLETVQRFDGDADIVAFAVAA